MPHQSFAETTKLGDTGVDIPRLCIGTSALANMPEAYGYEVDEVRARETLRAIFAGPVRFIDTSRNYGWGRSETLIGEVLAEIGGLPEGFLVSTKLDRDERTGKFDGSQARRSLEESLKALGVDSVGLLHLHDPEHAASVDEITGPGGALEELIKMKDEGLADAIGLAAGAVDVMMPILRDWDFDALISHNRYTLANRNAGPMIDLARERGVAVINAAPFGSGVLAKGTAAYPRYAYQNASEAGLAPIRRIEAICAAHGVPLGAAALQFSMRDARIACTLCGISRPERLAQIIEWTDIPIAGAVWDELMALPFDTADPEAVRVL